MSYWRVLGDLRHPRSKEEIETRSLDGWAPWREHWLRLMEPAIAVPDPADNSRLCHLSTHGVVDGEIVRKFAVHYLPGGICRFLVPAFLSAEGAFKVLDVMYEGYWRSSRDETSELPWPEPDLGWKGRPTFLRALAMLERRAERVAYRGYSICRLCGQRNGSQGLRFAEWEWPAGFRHYITKHHVKPTPQFEEFVYDQSEGPRPG